MVSLVVALVLVAGALLGLAAGIAVRIFLLVSGPWLEGDMPYNEGPDGGESQSHFMSRCMSALSDEFPDAKQRIAVCMKVVRGNKSTDVAYDDIKGLVDQLEAQGKL